MSWIISSLAIIFILTFTYNFGGKFLKNKFNLLFRDWILALVIVICMICILIIEFIIFTNLSKVLKKRVHIHNIFRDLIQAISMVLIALVNLYALFICIFIIAMGYQEVGVETYEGEKYLVSDTGWATPAHTYNYHPYKNFFVYDVDTKYSGEVKWEDYPEIEIDDKKDPDFLPNTTEEDTDNVIEEEVKIEVIPSNIVYIQKIDDNLNYGFYLIDRAMHQYLYAFVQSKDGGLSWEIVYTFPSTSEMYYASFLDKELGFINFGSSEGLSLFMTNDGGLTWKDVLINLPEGSRNMLYVQDIKKSGETIELILGLPSWSNPNKSIKYISIDKGLLWNLQI
jgi:hypothetical protein